MVECVSHAVDAEHKLYRAEREKVSKLCRMLDAILLNSEECLDDHPDWITKIKALLAECSSVQTNSTEEHLTNETETEMQQKQQEET